MITLKYRQEFGYKKEDNNLIYYEDSRCVVQLTRKADYITTTLREFDAYYYLRDDVWEWLQEHSIKYSLIWNVYFYDWEINFKNSTEALLFKLTWM